MQSTTDGERAEDSGMNIGLAYTVKHVWEGLTLRPMSVGDGNFNGYGDAFRHCYGSCLTAKYCGNSCAFILGWGNEVMAPDEWFSDSPMDICNNAKGRQVSSSGLDCATGCLDLLYGGGLRVDNKAGAPRPREIVEEDMLRHAEENR